MAKKPIAFMGSNDWINIPEGQETFSYEKKVRVQVGTGPRGGKKYETRTISVNSTERHAYNRITGKRITLRQYQNIQHRNREISGTPKSTAIPRTGKTRTIKNLSKRGYSTLYDKERHGQGEAIIFRDLQAARNYVLTNGIDEKFNNIVIQVKYAEKKRATSKVVNGVRIEGGSPKKKKSGYATLTPFANANVFIEGADYTSPNQRGEIQNPWYTAERNLTDYGLNSNSRIYLVMTER